MPSVAEKIKKVFCRWTIFKGKFFLQVELRNELNKQKKLLVLGKQRKCIWLGNTVIAKMLIMTVAYRSTS